MLTGSQFKEELSMKDSANISEPSTQSKASRQLGKRRSLGAMLSRTVLSLTLVVAVMSSVGCFLPIYSARPERRVEQLLFTSDNLRQVVDDWERFWQLDQPSHMSPIRTHGGIL
jgi:hypothetical protein